MSTTAVTIVATSTAIQAANNAKSNECVLMLETYDAKQASVKEMKQYTECIERLYPNQHTPEETQHLKILASGLLIAMIVGIAVEFYMDRGRNVFSFFECVLLGLLAGSAVYIGLILILGLVGFVFS